MKISQSAPGAAVKTLFTWFLAADEGNLDIAAAVGAGYINRERLAHYAFDDGTDD